MNFRDWLIILGVLAVMLIVADGFRRVWLYRRRANELNFGLENIKWQNNEFSSELPNGGARTTNGEGNGQSADIDFSDSQHLEPLTADAPDALSHNQSTKSDSEGEAERMADSPVSNEMFGIKEQQKFDLEQTVPMMNVDPPSHNIIDPDPLMISADRNVELPPSPDVMLVVEPEPERQAPCDDGVQESAVEVLVINLTAKSGGLFVCSDLFDLFVSEGLRFGEMNIFHRYIQSSGVGNTLFSVASGIEPGTFNLKTMNKDTTSVLSFFMGLPGDEGVESIEAFEIMVATVYRLAETLSATLKDDQHSVLTQQTLEYYRQRIRDFERRRMILHRKNNILV
ncbi:MAG: cell division protein ZipA [Endozoicomonadaceae bacterium]|nr:cell division protein ZipA [Endozoicomonadaceae bacterium]